jgi:ParB family transcriptional regulator, chromosome partitioning protein
MTIDGRRSIGGLGRGLAALIPPRPDGEAPTEILIREIRRNPYQPRLHVEQQELQRLAASIAEHGVIQPILVTPAVEGYQLVAGERRVRAAEMAGLERIPALIRTIGEQQQLGLALIENLMRSDLNAMDEARAFRRLADDFGLTQEEIGRRMGRARPSITNTLRLLELAPPIQVAVRDGSISEGHARAIGAVDDHLLQQVLLDTVVAKSLSVRQTEELARRAKRAAAAASASPADRTPDPDVERLEADLRTALGTKVTIAPGRRGGRITIEYYDPDELERLVGALTASHR